jgi:hypothetical protein
MTCELEPISLRDIESSLPGWSGASPWRSVAAPHWRHSRLFSRPRPHPAVCTVNTSTESRRPALMQTWRYEMGIRVVRRRVEHDTASSCEGRPIGHAGPKRWPHVPGRMGKLSPARSRRGSRLLWFFSQMGRQLHRISDAVPASPACSLVPSMAPAHALRKC